MEGERELERERLCQNTITDTPCDTHVKLSDWLRVEITCRSTPEIGMTVPLLRVMILK